MNAGPPRLETELPNERPLGPFARASDHAECRRLHRKHGTTYYFATQRFDRRTRQQVHALYAFVRVPDEWVDNPGTLTIDRRLRLLQDYRSQLLRGLDGVCPDHPVLRAFCDVVRDCGMPLDEPLIFLDAMEQDLTVARYRTYEDLRDYMRGSAAAVGVMMCSVLGAKSDEETLGGARALGEAMQLTNFLRDVGEDARRGRIYLPQEDMASFGVVEEDILQGRVTEPFRDLLRFEIARARALYAVADEAIGLLPAQGQKPVRLARVLYSRILNRIEALDYDVFTTRARTSKVEKLMVALRVAAGLS
ncbi:MAG: phytoene/squalene synthase family protein [Fimbriimonas sp.]